MALRVAGADAYLVDQQLLVALGVGGCGPGAVDGEPDVTLGGRGEVDELHTAGAGQGPGLDRAAPGGAVAGELHLVVADAGGLLGVGPGVGDRPFTLVDRQVADG